MAAARLLERRRVGVEFVWETAGHRDPDRAVRVGHNPAAAAGEADVLDFAGQKAVGLDAAVLVGVGEEVEVAVDNAFGNRSVSDMAIYMVDYCQIFLES